MPRACPFLGFLLLLYSRHFLNPVSLHSQLQLPRPTKKVRGCVGASDDEGSRMAVSQTTNQVASAMPATVPRLQPSGCGLAVSTLLQNGEEHGGPDTIPIACRAPGTTHLLWSDLCHSKGLLSLLSLEFLRVSCLPGA